MKELLVVVVFVAAVAWLISRIRQGNVSVRDVSGPKPLQSTSKYHAVSVKFSSNACDAAKATTGVRILSSTSPRLPLPECDAAECRCGFVHHKDRRSGDDRRSPFGSRSYLALAGSTDADRRLVRDRRRQADVA